MIDNKENIISIDDSDEEGKSVQLPEKGAEVYEETELKIALMEAISQLEDPDQRFVVTKKLEGYNSSEIADLMLQSWKKHGIQKYNNKGETVIPTAAYVDVRYERAKESLKKLVVPLF